MEETVARYSEDGLAIDMDAATQAMDESDVLVLGFDVCPERLLFDLRVDETTPPLVEVVGPLASAQERVVWLNARRPALQPPDSFVFFVWPNSIDHLEHSKMIERAVDRVHREQGVDITGDIEHALREVREHEGDDLMRAMRGGEGYETLWPV